MDPQLIEILGQLGPFGIVALALFYVVRIGYKQQPSDAVQLQLIGLMQSQGELDKENVLAIKEVAVSLRETVLVLQGRTTLFQEFFAKVHDEHAAHDTKQTHTLTTITEQFNTNNLQLDRMAGVMELAPNQEQLAAIQRGIEQLLTKLEEMRSEFRGRLDEVEQDVRPLKTAVAVMAKKVTSELTPVAQDKVNPPTPSSKSGARAVSEQEAAAIPPQETNDKPLTDTTSGD